jgi:acyl-homoserine lactone acylase PvdQ
MRTIARLAVVPAIVLSAAAVAAPATTINLPGLSAPAQIVRDVDGMPHIQ